MSYPNMPDAPPTYQQSATGSSAPSCPPGALPTGSAAAPPQYGATIAPPRTVTIVYQQMPGYGFGIEHQRTQAKTIKWLRLVPAFPICPVVMFMMFNCIIPGFGTLLSCFFLCCGNTVVRGDGMGKILCVTFWFGLLQLITCPIVIGYFLAIFWSYGTIMTYRMYYERAIEESEIQSLSP